MGGVENLDETNEGILSVGELALLENMKGTKTMEELEATLEGIVS